jgi:hypothetical protein
MVLPYGRSWFVQNLFAKGVAFDEVLDPIKEVEKFHIIFLSQNLLTIG